MLTLDIKIRNTTHINGHAMQRSSRKSLQSPTELNHNAQDSFMETKGKNGIKTSNLQLTDPEIE